MAGEVGRLGMLACQPLPDRAGLSRTTPAPPPADPISSWTSPMLLWLEARSLWNRVTDGFSRASRSLIARAFSYDASASAGRPVFAAACRCCCGSGQVALELGDRRVVCASRSRIARACSNDASASAGRPVSLCSGTDVGVGRGQAALELGDRRVLARQPLPDRAGLLVRRQRLRRPTRLMLQRADAVVTRGQVALELGVRRVLACQPLPDRAGLLVRRQCLRRPTRLTLQRCRCCCSSRPGRSGTR